MRQKNIWIHLENPDVDIIEGKKTRRLISLCKLIQMMKYRSVDGVYRVLFPVHCTIVKKTHLISSRI